MNLGTLDQKKQICIACASCVSLNVCVLSRGLQVSVFSPPSEERGATMGEFVCISSLISWACIKPSSSWVSLLCWLSRCWPEPLELEVRKCFSLSQSIAGVVTAHSLALTCAFQPHAESAEQECRTWEWWSDLLSLGIAEDAVKNHSAFQQDQRGSLPLKNSYAVIEC